MKKILLFLLCVPLLAGAQVQWNWRDSVSLPVTDTVIYNLKKDVSSWTGNLKLDLQNMDSTIYVGMGGWEIDVTGDYDYFPFANDSLPMQLPHDKYVVTVNGVSQNVKGLPIQAPYNYKYPAIYIRNSGATYKRKLYFDFEFSRP